MAISCVSFHCGVKYIGMDDWLFLLETVHRSWEKLGRPKRVMAAVSGGADSVLLLRVLHSLSNSENFALFAAHVDHGLRDTSSLDAQFVLRLCDELCVPCKAYRVSLSGKSEDEARSARYEALLSACAQADADALALAHHLQDQAETVLLHLFRGSGAAGLSGMREKAEREMPNHFPVVLWRPLLSVSPDRIHSALKAKAFSWREDETNAGDIYLRNFIRHQVLPKVQERIPRAVEAIARAAAALSDEEDYLQREAAAFLSKKENASLSGPCRYLSQHAFSQLHPAVLRYALRLSAPVSLSFQDTEGLMALHPGEKMNLPLGWRAMRAKGYLHYLPPPGEKEEYPPLGKLLILPYQGDPGDGKLCQAMAKEVFDQCVLRYGEKGDQIYPLGAPGKKSMQDYWVDKKVDQPFRRYMPLLCIGQRVVWAIGVGPGEEARIPKDRPAVMLRYEGDLPFSLKNDPKNTEE